MGTALMWVQLHLLVWERACVNAQFTVMLACTFCKLYM